LVEPLSLRRIEAVWCIKGVRMVNLLILVFVGVLVVIFLLAATACDRELLRNEKDESPHYKHVDGSTDVKKAA
jgi:hypothetical protein